MVKRRKKRSKKKKKARDLAYFPEDIKKIGDKHINMATGKQTYPSWMERSRRDFIYPEDLDDTRQSATDDDRQLLHLIKYQLIIDGVEIPEDGLRAAPVLRAIEQVKSVGERAAYQLLYGLWRADLVKREGVLHQMSGRPMHQRWFL